MQSSFKRWQRWTCHSRRQCIDLTGRQLKDFTSREVSVSSKVMESDRCTYFSSTSWTPTSILSLSKCSQKKSKP